MRSVVALIAGAIFGLGLVISDMIDPARVLAFLDITSGRWDPTLALVMGGAILPMIAAWRGVKRLSAPVTGGSFPGPVSAGPDRSLVLGAILFGAGWGVIGLCPGPALAALFIGGWELWLFVAAMMVGMAVHRWVIARTD